MDRRFAPADHAAPGTPAPIRRSLNVERCPIEDIGTERVGMTALFGTSVEG
jgi:hypothetical protein